MAGPVKSKSKPRARKAAKCGPARSAAPRKRAVARVKKTGPPVHRIESDRWKLLAWIAPLVVGFIVAGSLLKAPARMETPLVTARLEGLYQDASKNAGTGDRIAYWSERLLSEPKLLDPLGRGPAVDDSAPLFPPSFDCTTYVETVGALALSHATGELADRLVSIRYAGGKVAYETRNHFPEADWIPNNERAGLLRDMTIEVSRKAGLMAAFAYKDIDRVGWLKAQKDPHATRMLAMVSDTQEPVSVKLAYIPLEQASVALPHIPQGAVVNVVRVSSSRHPVLVSHQGFLVWKGGVAYFRHASRDRTIQEVPFLDYLRKLRGMPWRVVGINVDTFAG